MSLIQTIEKNRSVNCFVENKEKCELSEQLQEKPEPYDKKASFNCFGLPINKINDKLHEG